MTRLRLGFPLVLAACVPELPADSGPVADSCDAVAWFTDADGDGFGEDASQVDACDQPAGTVGVGGDCMDSDPAVYPGAGETCDGVDSNCSGDESDADDAEQVYADEDGDGYGDPDSATMGCAGAGAVTNHGDCDDGAVASNPDVRDETCNDGSDNNCDGSWSECRLTGTVEPTTRVDTSDLAGLVRDVGAADVTGDGIIDLVLGATSSTEGEVGIVVGPVTSTSATAFRITGGQPGDYFASAVAADGEVDGDGVNDVLVAAPGADDGRQVFLFPGSAFTGDLGVEDALVTLIAESPGDELGVGGQEGYPHPPSLAGDFDGDGAADILVGAPKQGGVGAVYVVMDGYGSYRVSDASARFTGQEAGDAAGTSVAVLGDVNGDGWEDFAVSAPSRDGGTVYVELGGASLAGDHELAGAAATWTGPSGEHQAGVAIRSLGDLFEDGGGALGIGTVGGFGGWAIDASLTGARSLDDADLAFSADSVQFAGHSVASVDLDHDGHRDLLVCGGDYEYLLYGPFTAPALGIGDDTQGVLSEAGCGVTTGDVNGDGYADVVTFYGYTGATDVYLGSGE